MQTLCSSGVFSSKWCPWLVQNLCSSGSFFFKNGAFSWCKIVLIWSFFLQIVLLAGANLCSSVAFLVLFWCSVMVPSLCIWFNISFSGKKWCSWLVQNLRSSGAFFSTWCSWLVQNVSSSGIFSFKMVLLAGAQFCAHLACFLQNYAHGCCTHLACFLQNGSPGWCAICAHLILFFFKMVLLARLLAGATCVLIWCFPSKWCSWLVQNLLMLPQQRSR